MDIALNSKNRAKNEIPLERYIPQLLHVSPHIVKTSSGEYQTFLKVAGVTFDTLGSDSIDSYHRLLVNWLNTTLKGGEFALTHYRIRRQLDANMETTYNNDFSEILADEYYSSFKGMRMLQTELYLCIHFKPKIDAISRNFMKNMSFERLSKLQDEYIEKLTEVANLTKNILQDFDLEQLGVYEKNNVIFSEVKNFLGFLVNGEWLELPLLEKPLNEQITYAVNTFQSEYRSIKTVNGQKFASYLDLTDYPEEFNTGALDKLLYSNFEFIEVMTFQPDNVVDGKAKLERMEGYVISAGDVTQKELDDFATAKEKQKDGELTFGTFHYCLAVFAPTFEQLLKVKSEAFGIMTAISGFQTSVISTVSPCGFFSQLAGNWDWLPRSAYISDAAFFGMASLHNFGAGKRHGNPWGDAVTILKTPSLQPFCFNFHVTDINTNSQDDKAPANTCIIGATGSGKTVLETFLVSHLMKVKDIRVVAFDKDRGLEPFIRRVGGLYQPLQIGVPTGWNPFQAQEATPRYLSHVNKLMQLCIEKYGKPSIDETIALERGIRAVFNLPKHLRGVTALLQNITEKNSTDGNGNDLAKKLREWAIGDDGRDNGINSWVFDNPTDNLDLDKYIAYAFDYTELLEFPELNTPMLFHLLYRNELMLDGRPYVYIMAEFWKALQNPIFTDFAKNKQKTIRKQNGFGIFDTQEPADMIKSEIGGTMVQQSVTKIFLPNPEAIWKDYEVMGCTFKVFEIIKNLNVNSRQFIILQGHQAVLAMLDLKGMTQILDILSGSTDNVEILTGIIDKVGDDPRVVFPLYHRSIAQRRGNYSENDFIFTETNEPLFTTEDNHV